MTRDRAIEIFRDDASGASLFELAEAVDMAIEALKEQRPRGEWIGNRFGIQCSECGLIRNAVPYEMNFCPNCGAPMTEEALRRYNGLKEGEAE